MDRLRTEGATSTNQIRTPLPAIRTSNSNMNLTLPGNLNGAEDIKKLYFKKNMPKRNTKNKEAQLPPGMSRRQLAKLVQKQRETAWDSRFVLERIPELFPKNREFSVDTKPKKLHVTDPQKQLLYATGRIGLPDLRDKRLSGDEQPYYTNPHQPSEKSSQLHVEKEEKQSTGHTKDATSARQFSNQPTLIPRGLIQKRDTVYRMESMYLQKEIPEFHRNIVKQIFNSIKNKEEYALPRLVVREFRQFFDSIDTAITCVGQRDEAVRQLLMTLKQRNQKMPEKLLSAKEEIEPILLEISILTLNCIESIVRWKEKIRILATKFKLQHLSFQSVAYLTQQNQNYLKKILIDTQFLYESKLYNGAYFPDPFFLSYNLQEIYQDRDLIYKIRASELFLLEQNVN